VPTEKMTASAAPSDKSDQRIASIFVPLFGEEP
jgi:hypothetical protein